MNAAEGKDPASGLVRMGEVQVSCGAEELSCMGVGSGIVMAAYDPKSKVGACAHFILPAAPSAFDVGRAAKYVDTGLAELVRQMVSQGADKSQIRCALAGGSSLKPHDASFVEDLGARNLEAAAQAIEREGIHCMAQDVGGRWGRTVKLSTTDGAVRIQSSVQPQRMLCRLRG